VFRRTLRRQAGLAVAAIAAVAMMAAAPAGAQAQDACLNTDIAPTSENIDVVRSATLCLLNQERTSHGLKSLTENAKLRGSATSHNNNMLQSRFFEHNSPGGSTMVSRIRKAGYMRNASSWAVGENLAWGTGRLSTAAETQAAWMRSPGHRANIMRARYREIGIAIAPGVPVTLSASQLGATYTTDFGYRS
jgi:uncharacterized protein YkwD